MKKQRYNRYLADREMRMLDLYCGLRDAAKDVKNATIQKLGNSREKILL